jgi:hypothetical protein
LIALIINAHQFERDGIDVEFCLSISNVFFCLTYRASRYMRPLSAQVGRRPVAPTKKTPTLRPDFHRD